MAAPKKFRGGPKGAYAAHQAAQEALRRRVAPDELDPSQQVELPRTCPHCNEELGAQDPGPACVNCRFHGRS